MSTTISSCLKSYFRIFGNGSTTAGNKNLFAETNFAQRTSRGTNITYDTNTNQIVFGNTGTRYFEVLFMGAASTTSTNQNVTVSIVVNGVTQKSMVMFIGSTGSYRQVTLYGVYSCTNGTTLQINYSGTGAYVHAGSSVIVRFIS